MSVFSLVTNQGLSLLTQLPGSGVGKSAGAGSPFSTYTAGVLIYGILVGVLVAGLLLGAFLILNLGLLSKRPGDRIGSRTPSDLGILKSELWPQAPYEKTSLPADEQEEEDDSHQEIA